MPSLLTLADVMGTGHHAAVVAGVGPDKRVAIVGDGAVGLCGVIAAKRLGAEQIIVLGRHPARTDLALDLGATDIVPERGEEAVERVRELTGGLYYGMPRGIYEDGPEPPRPRQPTDDPGPLRPGHRNRRSQRCRPRGPAADGEPESNVR